MSQYDQQHQVPVAYPTSYPPPPAYVMAPPASYVMAPPAAKDDAHHQDPATTTSRGGGGFLKGCMAGLCCCWCLDCCF